MNEDSFNMSIRKFLKTVGVTSQREIEIAVRKALAEGRLSGSETLPARVRLQVADVALDLEIEGELTLE